jgi:GAF domain-containing protein
MLEPSAISPTAYASETEDVERSPEFETLISELAADFVAMRASAIDDGIDRWLDRIVRVLGLDRMTVAQLTDDDASVIVRTHSYTVPGYMPLSPRVRQESDVPWLAVQMRTRRTVLIPKVSDLPPEAAREREFMLAEGLKSNVSIPIIIGGDLIGWISFTSMSAEREWREDEVNRLQLITNIFAGALRRKRDDFELDRMRRFEELLSRISATFVKLSTDEIDGALTSALQEVIEFLSIDRGTILSMSADRSVLLRTHWHANPGVEPMAPSLSTAYSWTFTKLNAGEPVVISRTSELPDAAEEELKYFRRAGVRSTVAIPLMLGNGLLGAAIFSATQTEKRWQDPLVQRLRLLGEIFANALARKRLEKSHQDLLRFEQLISMLSARFAGIPGWRVDEEIRRALQEVLEFFDADQCGIFEAIPETREVYLRYLAHRPGVIPVPTDTDYAQLFPWEYEQLCILGEVVVMKRLDDLPPEASIDRSSKAAIGMQSTVEIPVAVAGAIRFFFSIGFNSEERIWPDDYIPRLRLLGDTLVGALSRARADEALHTSEERFRSVVEAARHGQPPDGANLRVRPRRADWETRRDAAAAALSRTASCVSPRVHDRSRGSRDGRRAGPVRIAPGRDRCPHRDWAESRRDQGGAVRAGDGRGRHRTQACRGGPARQRPQSCRGPADRQARQLAVGRRVKYHECVRRSAAHHRR